MSQEPSSQYAGAKDLGRAESLYRSALAKPDLDYSTQLLFSSLIANPEHDGAFTAILGKLPVFAAAKRKMIVRVSDLLAGAPADQFIKALATYCASVRSEDALLAAIEAQKVGLGLYATILAERVVKRIESGNSQLKSASVMRLLELLETCSAMELAARAVRCAVKIFPDEQAFREREKNVLATKYMRETEIESSPSFRENLRDRTRQEQLHRAADPQARLDELEQRFRQTLSFEDFRELVRALREASASRREAALPTLEEGLRRFDEKETRWFIREIQLAQRQTTLDAQSKQLSTDSSGNEKLRQEHERLRREVQDQRIEHLYEVVSSLPNVPERQKRQFELATALLDAGRFEEAIKQAQAHKRRSENRLDSLMIMAKSFVQLGLTFEAAECFQSILGELNSTSSSIDQILEAKYAYAQFLTQEASRTREETLARQARKLCSDVMVEDIDFRDIRALAAEVSRLLRTGAAQFEKGGMPVQIPQH